MDAEKPVNSQANGNRKVYRGGAAQKRAVERVKRGFVRRSEAVPCNNALAKKMYRLVMDLDKLDPADVLRLERAWQRVEQEFRSIPVERSDIRTK